ncbi:MAG: choice-of-anchor E domain-containing protein [Chthoniobacterales bacterium]
MRLRYLPLAAAIAVSFLATTHAATLTKNFSITGPTVDLGATSNVTGYVDQFDATTYGTLTSVSITYDAQTIISNKLKNNGGSTMDVAANWSANLKLEFPSGTTVVNNDYSNTTEFHTLNPGQEITINTTTTSFTPSSVNYSGDLSAFIGTGTWSYLVSGQLKTAAVAYDPSGSGVVITSSTISPSITTGTVTYTYSPAPEPSTYALLGLGALLVAISARKRLRA